MQQKRAIKQQKEADKKVEDFIAEAIRKIQDGNQDDKETRDS